MTKLIFASASLLLGSVLGVSAQGTVQFQAVLTGLNEVPPNFDPTVATASLTLDGNSLSFYVDVPAVTFTATSGSINGPAASGEIAPQLFNLGGPHFHPGSDVGGGLPGYIFASPFGGGLGAGPFTLNETQIAQLEAGSWYMDIQSFQTPTGQLRGQILMVPEPSALALWIVGIGVFCASMHLKNHTPYRSVKMNR
jgi:hypothetical protein